MNRSETILKIAKAITELRTQHPLRIAVNGRIASGKTTFAIELAKELRQMGYPVRHVGVDGFHNPREVRYWQGRASARGYYEDAYDLDSLRKLLLEPLGKPPNATDGLWNMRTASLDLETDMPIDAPLETMSANEILIIDGSFLLVPKLCDFWDYVVFIDVSRDVATERGARRDADRLNGEAEARHLHNERYQPACDLYLQENEPIKYANAIVVNTYLKKPVLHFPLND